LVKQLLLLPVLLLVTSNLASAGPTDEQIAHRAKQYQRILVGVAYDKWGQTAPIQLLAAQVHQESRWNPTARSKYACGLTQFTPDTAKWISDTYRVSVGPGDCLNPIWALRAQAQYMYVLQARRSPQSATNCDSWRFALWDYNGGPGWTNRDRALTEKLGGNSRNAQEVAPRNAGRKAEFFRENRSYDIGIINKWQPLYKTWGGPVTCLGGIPSL
jgi:membrane-bound lytic murein transglycosylase MltF